MQKVVVPVVGALMILGVFAFTGGFNPGASRGEYTLGGFWQTWALSAVLFAAAPLSGRPAIGGYTPPISARPFSNRRTSKGTCIRHVLRGLPAQPLAGCSPAFFPHC